MSDNDKLSEIRDRIDALDRQIQTLINERAACAQEVAHIKLEADPDDTTFYRPEREAMVLRAVKERNEGPLGGEEMARLFREIMSACLALEKPLNIAFLGPEGTFTQAAALKHFGHSVTTTSLGSIADVFREVEAGSCDYGVVPVENSTEGVVSHTLDLFINSPLSISGEVIMRIHHNLLGKQDDWQQAKTVYSHQQSLAQCRRWLDQHLLHARRVAVGSNAEAARIASADAESLAIASSEAANLYKLRVHQPNIEDEPGNTTRFLIIGRQQPGISGDDKTSLLLSTKNEAGGLHRLLAPLAEHGISMTRIESRPSRRGMWDYVFFVDIVGHKDDPRVAAALNNLESEAGMLKILGSYPSAVL
ncbi:MAG: prephenate dehydratase [Gammaproteobacteria bacterium]